MVNGMLTIFRMCSSLFKCVILCVILSSPLSSFPFPPPVAGLGSSRGGDVSQPLRVCVCVCLCVGVLSRQLCRRPGAAVTAATRTQTHTPTAVSFRHPTPPSAPLILPLLPPLDGRERRPDGGRSMSV